MLYRRVLTIAVLLALFGSMMLGPVTASFAHGSAASVAVDSIEGHGHTHASDVSDAHDAIDHLHDVSIVLQVQNASVSWWRRDWPIGQFAVRPSGVDQSQERPPRATL